MKRIVVWATVQYAVHVDGATVHVTGPEERKVAFGNGVNEFATLSGGEGYINSTVTVNAPDFVTMTGTSVEEMITVIRDQQVAIIAMQARMDALQAELRVSSFKLDCTVGRRAAIPEGVTHFPLQAFYQCDQLETVHIPASVEYIEREAFKDTPLLRNVTFAEGINLTYIGYQAFMETPALTSITLPASLKGIGIGAFSQSGLTGHLTIPAGVTKIEGRYGQGGAFSHTDLTSVTLHDGITEIDDYAFDAVGTLTSINFPEGLTRIGNRAFLYSGLSTVTLPSTLTYIDEYAFYSNPNLGQVIVPNGCTVGKEVFGGTSGGWRYAG